MLARVACSSVSMTTLSAAKPKLLTSISRKFVMSLTQPLRALPGYLLMPTSIAYFTGGEGGSVTVATFDDLSFVTATLRARGGVRAATGNTATDCKHSKAQRDRDEARRRRDIV